MSRTLAHLEQLVSFGVLPGQANGQIVDYVRGVLETAGARVWQIDDPQDGGKSGLFASIGPEGPGGVMLSGHMDVVTPEGQDWASDPFKLYVKGARAYGRGTTDMKGFLAAMLNIAELASAQAPKQRLKQPLKFAFSWDEEIGCKGIPVMLDQMHETVGMPDMCIVGEPTNMQIVTAHKGKTALRAVCAGEAGHSSDAPSYENALHRAADFIAVLREAQAQIAQSGARDSGYATPYSTIHAGVMRGGRALNVVPDFAEVLFEIRTLAQDKPEDIIARLTAAAEDIGGVTIEVTGGYPGLSTAPKAASVAFMKKLLPEAELTNVSFGTEAGHFAERGVDTIVCGPGSMDQGHKADEFIELSQLAACDEMLARVFERLSSA